MRNYQILKGIPKDSLDNIKNEWELSKGNLRDNSHFYYMSIDEYQDLAIVNDSHPLHDIVKSFIDIPYDHIMFLISNANSGLGPIHIDAGRGCGINIPLEVDFVNSCFFIANQECTERPFHDGEPVHEGTKRFFYEPEKYDYYNVREPIVINTKKAHGFFNHSNTTRVLFSISFNQSYEEIITHLKLRGYA